MKNVLVSGATGFIGRRLVAALLDSQKKVGALTRGGGNDGVQLSWAGRDVSAIVVDLRNPASLRGACEGFDTVFHLAGYAHAEDADDGRADETHWRVTVEGTGALLREAARAGAKRFVFVSTVKAMGEGSGSLLDEDATAKPASGYGRAKLEAERLVLAAGREQGIHACVIRLPLVYGPDNKGNIRRMIAAIDRGRFPPLPAIENRRSMIHVDDVVRAALLVAEHPEANGKTYIVTDDHPYSTREIYLAIRTALGKRPPRWSVPLSLLEGLAKAGDLIGRVRGRRFVFDSNALEKLTGSAWYSSAKIARELGFVPRYTFEDALPEIIEAYRRGANVVR